ncbi:50S ribosomal protein L3 [Spirochaetia bacterium]|nr:50S ribosomal protein L3 [Spirochaetia bacterium]
MLGLLAKKVGMTQVFNDAGNMIPVTAISIEPNIVLGNKTEEHDGYNATILGIDTLKKNKITKPYAGQFPEAISPLKHIKEFRDFEKEVSVGEKIGLEIFEGCRYVDVTGISKGKGFQGVMKRWGFAGGRRTHGSKFHREPGSTGQSTYPHKTFKNMKLPGRMGREQVTTLSLRVVKIDTEKKIILVNGSVPGVNKSTIIIRFAVKK